MDFTIWVIRILIFLGVSILLGKLLSFLGDAVWYVGLAFIILGLVLNVIAASVIKVRINKSY